MDKLTYRETEILKYVADGLTAKQIAQCIGLERRTIEIYIQNLRKKLGAKNTAHAIYLYFCNIAA